jgi:hypothetical protein
MAEPLDRPHPLGQPETGPLYRELGEQRGAGQGRPTPKPHQGGICGRWHHRPGTRNGAVSDGLMNVELRLLFVDLKEKNPIRLPFKNQQSSLIDRQWPRLDSTPRIF